MHLESDSGSYWAQWRKKPKHCQRHYFNMCFVANILRTHQHRLDRVINKADDIPTIAYGASIYVTDDNHRNPSNKAKYQ